MKHTNLLLTSILSLSLFVCAAAPCPASAPISHPTNDEAMKVSPLNYIFDLTIEAQNARRQAFRQELLNRMTHQASLGVRTIKFQSYNDDVNRYGILFKVGANEALSNDDDWADAGQYLTSLGFNVKFTSDHDNIYQRDYKSCTISW